MSKITGICWINMRKHAFPENHACLISEHPGSFVVLEESDDEHSVSDEIRYDEVILLDERQAVAGSSMILWWRKNGSLRKLRVDEDSADVTAFRSCKRQILARWGITFATDQRRPAATLAETLADRDSFRRVLAGCLGQGEDIESLIYQPPSSISRRIYHEPKRPRTAQQMMVQTTSRWILITGRHDPCHPECATQIRSLPRVCWSVTARDDDTLVWNAGTGIHTKQF